MSLAVEIEGFDWLIDWLLIYVPHTNISLIWRRHHYRRKAAKFRPMLGAQGLWAGRDLYRATSAVTRGLHFSSLIRMSVPFNRLLQQTRGCGGSILTSVLTVLFMLFNAIYMYLIIFYFPFNIFLCNNVHGISFIFHQLTWHPFINKPLLPLKFLMPRPLSIVNFHWFLPVLN
jgi:hypothetical protein